MGTELVCLQVCSFFLPLPWAALFKTGSVLNSVADNFRIATLKPVASSQVDVQRGAFLDKDPSECHPLLETKPTETKPTNFALLCPALQFLFSTASLGVLVNFCWRTQCSASFGLASQKHWWMELQETICLFLCPMEKPWDWQMACDFSCFGKG